MLALVFGSVFLLPQYLVEQDLGPSAQLPPAELVKAKNDVRSTLLQGIGGLLLVVGAIAAWRQLQLGREQMLLNERLSRQQLEVSEQGQVTERFTRAVEQLADDNLHVRVGGVFGLKLLAADPKIDRAMIVQILLALIHQRSPWPPRSGQTAGDIPVEELRSLWVRSADVATAAAVIADLHVPDEMRSDVYLGRVDLRRADLRRADLAGFWLGRSNLFRAELEGAKLDRAILDWSILAEAQLKDASLKDASLKGASLEDAVLRGVDFQGAQLDGANLTGAIANADTRWPKDFDWKAAGVIMEDTNHAKKDG